MKNKLLMSLFLCILFFWVPIVSAYGGEVIPLLEPTVPEGNLLPENDTLHIRNRLVAIDFALLPNASTAADELILNLFEDATFTATLEETTVSDSGGFLWKGHIEGHNYSRVILAVSDEFATGNVIIDNLFFQIRPLGNGVHVVYEINQSAFPSEAEPLENGDEKASEDPSDIQDDDGSVIDVLVVYSDDAKRAAGGTPQIHQLIDIAEQETNDGYRNSNIDQRIKVVYKSELEYTETGNAEADVRRLQDPGDGQLDEAHTLRDIYGTDAVILIVNQLDACGRAFGIMDPVSLAFRNNAFAVVKDSCATGDYSFGHELGHLFSARHDWYIDPADNAPFPYNHGHVNVTQRWRTIMAYDNKCMDQGVTCTRINYWSNPDLDYFGTRLGVPEGQPQPTDNRKTLNTTDTTAANWRESVKQDISHEVHGITTCEDEAMKCQILTREYNSFNGNVVFTGGGYSGSPTRFKWRCGTEQDFYTFIEIHIDDQNHIWDMPDVCVRIGEPYALEQGHTYDFRGPSIEGASTVAFSVAVLPDCIPPFSGDWVVTESCTFEGFATVPSNVIVQNNAVLTISPIAALNIDFLNHFLLVKQGSGVLIKNGGKLY